MKKLLVINASARTLNSQSRPDCFKTRHYSLCSHTGDSGYEKGEHNEHLDFQTHHLKTVFSLINIINIHAVAVNSTTFGPEQLKISIGTAHQKISGLIAMEPS